MGPYCKFCETRCFIPTPKDHAVSTDLMATCRLGKAHDLRSAAHKVANQVLSDEMSIVEASRFLAAIAEEIEEIQP